MHAQNVTMNVIFSVVTCQGGNKAGMGYDEMQFNLPRWEDLLISRQTVYDNTFVKLPSQGSKQDGQH